MKIIKDKQIIEDNWTHIADDSEVTGDNITVSLSRWKKNKLELNQLAKNVGVRLSPADKVEDIADDLKQICLIALEFPAFTDGRSFSQARLLRSRYGFENEIRAMGSYMPDQVFYLSRVGINAFQFKTLEALHVATSTLNDFSVQYQTSTN